MAIKGLFVILSLFGILGCNNKSISTPPRELYSDPDIISEETKLSDHLLDAELELSNANETKTAINQDMGEYLLLYFSDGKYKLLDEPLNVNSRNINFAVHYINDDLEICDVVVGYENDNGVFRAYLAIKDFCFINEDGSILLDFSKDYEGIYGFNISYSYPKVSGYTPGLNIDTYFNNGNRVADTFTIIWNEEEKIFEEAKWF
jgi:hypothetical protein